METEIVNKVANSILKVFDLEDYYPKNPRLDIDISQWLYQGFVLREKEFRAVLKEMDWSAYKDAFVGLYCSTDAILPQWTYMLIASHLDEIAAKVFLGTKEQIDTKVYQEIIDGLDFSIYQDLPVIIKGCSKLPIPEEAYVLATNKMCKYARSVMFGEACSAVPIFKRKVNK